MQIFLAVARAALARADVRACSSPRCCRRRRSRSRAGGRSSRSRASRPGRTTRTSSTTTRSMHSLVDDGRDRGRQHAARRRSSARWPATRSPGSSSPGRDWLFIGVIGLLVVPLQMALIPMFTLYDHLGIFDTVLGIVLFHAAFGLPFAIFLLRNFFVGIPQGHPRVGAHRRRLRAAHLRAADPAARPAGDRLARDLPVPLDVERPDRRADLRPERAADHRRDLRATCASSARTST